MRSVTVQLSLEQVRRIDAIIAANQRSTAMRVWVLAGLAEAERSRDQGSVAYRLLGGDR